jgi:hypothetical protein
MISWSIFGGYPAWKLVRQRCASSRESGTGHSPGLGTCRQEDGTPPVGQPYNGSAWHRERQVIRVPASDGRSHLEGGEPWNRDRARLVRLRSAKDHATADIGKGPAHVNSATTQLNVADAQSGCFASAQAGPSSTRRARRSPCDRSQTAGSPRIVRSGRQGPGRRPGPRGAQRTPAGEPGTLQKDGGGAEVASSSAAGQRHATGMG